MRDLQERFQFANLIGAGPTRTEKRLARSTSHTVQLSVEHERAAGRRRVGRKRETVKRSNLAKRGAELAVSVFVGSELGTYLRSQKLMSAGLLIAESRTCRDFRFVPNGSGRHYSIT